MKNFYQDFGDNKKIIYNSILKKLLMKMNKQNGLNKKKAQNLAENS